MSMIETVRSLLAGVVIAAALTGLAPADVLARSRTPSAGDGGHPLERIAAVVNDDAISLTDTEARLRLALLSSNLPDNPDVRQRLLPQVLRSLIEERLQIQETKRLNISVPDQEVNAALAKIAEQNRMQRGDFERLLKSHNVPVSTLINQIRASLGWNKLVQRKLRPQVFVSDDEIDAYLERLRANNGKPEYLTAEIFLSVDTPAQDEEVRRTGDHLVDMMRQGAPFSAVARQFSQAAGANTGGDLGWVQIGQLSDELNKALVQLRPGQVSPPVRSPTGYHILMVRDQRTVNSGDPNETDVHLMQMVFPINGGDKATPMARAQDVGRRVHSCEAFAKEIKASRSGADMGTVKAGGLPPDIAQLVSALPIGQVSQPFGNDRQLVVLMVCERKTAAAAAAPGRDVIQASLGNERIEQLQRRYLYDLRRSAYVDVRM
ncbi:MAG: peptidylprolyl isomerase [Rhodospirillaceae bacterium]